MKDKGTATAMAREGPGQGHGKAPDAINYSDEEDMIDDEDAPAQHAIAGSPAPQCVSLLFAWSRTLST